MPTQFRVDSSALPPSTTVVGFRAREALSEAFTLEIALRTIEGRVVDTAAAVGVGMTLQVELPPSSPLEPLPEPHVWNGVIGSIEQVHQEGELSFWVAIVVPKVWSLKNTLHSRVFTVGTVPEIVEAVLLDEGLSSDDFRFELRGAYPSLEHVCTYRESSFDFISRLLEREGIAYYFAHEDGKHVMVLIDDMSAHMQARPAVQMRPLADDDLLSEEGFFEYSYEHRALPSEVVVTDYDYLRPSTQIEADAAIQRRQTGVVVEHGEFVPLPDEERRYADLRAEEILSREQWFTGRGRVSGLRSGYTFEVRGHGLSRLDDSYLVIEMESEGFELGSDEGNALWLARLLQLQARHGVVVTVGAIPASVQFRPMRTTPWPRIHGVVDGIADGMASSDYAQIDSQGRYRVRLRFDESDLLDGQASTWIRMLQPHGGSVEGFHFPLRKGTEVQVAFLGGDPDRPVIVGAVPNAIEQSKVRTVNHTQNIIHTGGDNTITMEDVAGGMFITNFSPPDASTLHLGTGANQVDLRTDGQGHLHTGASHDIDVHGNKIETVAGTLTETYGGVLTLDVTGAVMRTMATSLTQTITGPVTEHVIAALTETVTASVTETYNTGQSTTVTGGVLQTYNATLAHTVNASPLTETISSARTRTIGATLDHHTTGHAAETFGATTRSITGDYTETINGTYTLNAPQVEVICTQDTWIDAGLDVIDGYHAVMDAISEWTGDGKIGVNGVKDSITGLSLSLFGNTNTLTLGKVSATGASATAAGIEQYSFSLWKAVKGARIMAAGITIYL
jgi:type VI secretion system secreted protein VgrG